MLCIKITIVCSFFSRLLNSYTAVICLTFYEVWRNLLNWMRVFSEAHLMKFTRLKSSIYANFPIYNTLKHRSEIFITSVCLSVSRIVILLTLNGRSTLPRHIHLLHQFIRNAPLF